MTLAVGTLICDGIIDSAKRHVKDAQIRKLIYEEVITVLEDADCDTLKDCKGKDEVFDQALENMALTEKQ